MSDLEHSALVKSISVINETHRLLSRHVMEGDLLIRIEEDDDGEPIIVTAKVTDAEFVPDTREVDIFVDKFEGYDLGRRKSYRYHRDEGIWVIRTFVRMT